VYGGAATTLSNSIISGNTVTETYSPPWGLPPSTVAWDCAGTITGGYDLIQTTSNCGYTAGTGDVVGVDPMLGKLQGNGGWTMTQEPHPGSPAIDRGGSACMATDQRGMPRSDDGNLDGTQRCDIGAVEAEAMDSTWYRVRYDGWSGTGDSSASGGGYRSASTAGATATFSEQGSTATSSVGFLTYKGPNMGRAAITVDGVYEGTIDLYASALTRKNYNYSTSSALSHTVVVKVLGTKSSLSSGTEVRVDAFRRGTTIVEDTSPSVRFGSWAGGRSGQALNGSYRIGTAGGTLTFDTVGPVFTFITERGPTFGKAQVTVDGVNKGTIDCYAPTTRWLSRQTFSGLGTGTHHVVITVLGTKNAASTGTAVVFDAITLR
jgi:hypothetical protein